MADRLTGQILAQPVISPQGEFLADEGEKLSAEKAMEIEDAGVMFAYVRLESGREVKVRLALEKIAEIENIEISDEKADEEYAKIAESYGMTADQVKKFVSLEALKADMKVSEAAEIVKSNAKIEG